MIATPTRPDFDDDAFDDGDDDLVVGTSLVPLGVRVPVAAVDGPDWAGHVLSDAAEACIASFAGLEADVSSGELSGVGRVSAVRFPRLGGVLHGRIAPGSRAAALLTTAVERTIRAGYQAALATQQVASVPVEHRDAEELWAAFVPVSYRIPRSVATTTWDVCRFDLFWVELLTELGLDGDANRFGNGHVSPLSRSIRGLSTVGVALALAERGGRHDRLSTARRTTRGLRRQGRGLPPAPRIVLDGVDED